MGIKETPVNFRVYFKNLKDKYTELKETQLEAKNKIVEAAAKLREEIENNKNVYKTQFNIDIDSYEEYKTDKYIDGTFLKIATGLFINRKNNYTIVSDLFNLYSFAGKQKAIYIANEKLELYNQILQLSLKEYNNLLKIFYTEVHKAMILEGYGYVFEDNIGWTCINRCKINKRHVRINYAETKKRKEELLAAGKRVYSKEEAEWCEKNGIEYNGVDARVYLENEYCYEIPLLGCKLPNGYKHKLEITDYRGSSVRGKSNKDLAIQCNNKLEKVCELALDIRAKLNICNDIDKTLYTKFIRNENQEPINIAKAHRKNRQ